MNTIMIKALIGDMFKTEMQTLVNTVNCVGVMGKGIALMFKKAYPAMYEDYVARCEAGEVELGRPYLYKDFGGASVLNFPTKGHWRASTRLSDIENGLDHFVKNYKSWGVESIAFAPLGCGNGGLEWSTVGPLMWSKLQGLDIPVEIYAPFGTPNKQLAEDFLSADQQQEFESKGQRPEKMRAEWAAILEVLYQLESQPYANPIGRTIFQKICYILTKQGLNTGFRFEANSYGPYADEIKKAISTMANANWLIEEQKGRMNAMRVGPLYKKQRNSLLNGIAPYSKEVNKTVDLFARVKNTDQAEAIATVIFSVQTLKQASQKSISENDVFEHILDWKKTWAKSSEKKSELGSTIRNLEMLRWIKLEYSDSLPVEA